MMTQQPTAKPRRPLRGPWLTIAVRVKLGNNTRDMLKLCAGSALERAKVDSNVDKMLELGFLREFEETTMGQFADLDVVEIKLTVSRLGNSLMPDA